MKTEPLVKIGLVIKMLFHSTKLDRKSTLFFQVVIIVKLDFMKTKITLGHSSMQINLSTLGIWKCDTHETNSRLQLQVNRTSCEVFKKHYLLSSRT